MSFTSATSCSRTILPSELALTMIFSNSFAKYSFDRARIKNSSRSALMVPPVISMFALETARLTASNVRSYDSSAASSNAISISSSGNPVNVTFEIPGIARSSSSTILPSTFSVCRSTSPVRAKLMTKFRASCLKTTAGSIPVGKELIWSTAFLTSCSR